MCGQGVWPRYFIQNVQNQVRLIEYLQLVEQELVFFCTVVDVAYLVTALNILQVLVFILDAKLLL